MIIYIALWINEYGYANQLECSITKCISNKLHFKAVNGGWDGYFDLEQQIVNVNVTREKVPAKIVYCGNIKGRDYNERINNVIEHIRINGSVSETELRNCGCISGTSKHATSVKKRSKSNGIQVVILSESSKLEIDKKHKEARLYNNYTRVREMSLEVDNV